MSTRVVTLRSDDETIIEGVQELTLDAVGKLAGPERQHCDATIRRLVSGFPSINALEEAVNGRVADEVCLAARIGFFLGLSLVSHGPLGDVAWLTEALRLAGEDVAVEVRQVEA